MENSSHTDTLERLSRDIVSRIYCDILSKIQSNCEVYLAHFTGGNCENEYFRSEINRLKMLDRYVSFLMKNSAYYGTVRDTIKEYIDNGSLGLFIYTGFNKKGIQPAGQLLHGETQVPNTE